VGDITPHDGVSREEKHRRESEAIQAFGLNAISAFEEYEAQVTPESQFVKRLDQMDMALQAEIYEAQGLDLSEFKQ
jgi:putative hydrolase of HD superfamily